MRYMVRDRVRVRVRLRFGLGYLDERHAIHSALLLGLDSPE